MEELVRSRSSQSFWKRSLYSYVIGYFSPILVLSAFFMLYLFYNNEVTGRALKSCGASQDFANAYGSLTPGTGNTPFKNINPLYGFVLYRGYRLEKFRFIAIGAGVSRWKNERSFESCYFRSHKSDIAPVYGNLSVHLPGETHGRQYETVLVLCYLPNNPVSELGGELHLVVHGTDIVFYSEEPRSIPYDNPKSPFKHQLTLCSPPIYGDVNVRLIYEWLEYHMRMGLDYFIMYDAGGVNGKLSDLLDAYVKKGVMEIHDVRASAQYDVWFFMQNMLLNDCAHRTRYTSRWSIVMDFDEFWSAANPQTTLISFLQKRSWNIYVSFGTLDWSIHHCLDKKEVNESQWLIEKMLYHRPNYFCKNDKKFNPEVCLDYYGHRKYAFNPRRVLACKIHNLLYPRYSGDEVSAKLARFNHYRGIAIVDDQQCNSTIVRPTQRKLLAEEKQADGISRIHKQARRMSEVSQLPDWIYSENISRLVKNMRLQQRFVTLKEAKLV